MAEPRINCAPEDCGFCQGTGKDKDLSHSPCEVCSGEGSILVAQPPKKCAFCGGSGRDKDYPHRRCESCNGAGWAHALLPEETPEIGWELGFPPILDPRKIRGDPFRRLSPEIKKLLEDSGEDK